MNLPAVHELRVTLNRDTVVAPDDPLAQAPVDFATQAEIVAEVTFIDTDGVVSAWTDISTDARCAFPRDMLVLLEDAEALWMEQPKAALLRPDGRQWLQAGRRDGSC